ncbi:MAG TPA: CHY zinc finger protein [Flavisolibacter sp.]|jgi:uncharacterized CHY-type Zn-finger protein|nr:CHY zinc finger protein [Flavisolibacter sp.]
MSDPQTWLLKGRLVDAETRCVHYHSPLDIIAIRFKCCNSYYPCYSCHTEEAGHEVIRWALDDRNEKAILCGACQTELTIQQYFDAGNSCPNCQSAFNPKCALHYPLYFEMES